MMYLLAYLYVSGMIACDGLNKFGWRTGLTPRPRGLRRVTKAIFSPITLPIFMLVGLTLNYFASKVGDTHAK